MTTKDMASIIFRFFGVYTLLLAIELLGIDVVIALAGPARYLNTFAAFVRHFFPSLIMGTLSVTLFAFSDQLASKIIPARLADHELVELVPGELQAILFSFAGILVILQGVNVISQSIAQSLNSTIERTSHSAFASVWMLTPGIIQILLGVVLFIKARAISEYWYRICPPPTGKQSNTEAV